MAKKYWLMKSEPSEFSIDNLERIGTQIWDGVRNYQVRNMFRDEMKAGDKALFYHSSCDLVGIVGEMEIISPAEVDPTQFNSQSKYFDPKSTKENPRWFGPMVTFNKKFRRIVSLTELKQNPLFQDLPLVQRGNRLSVFPISKDHYQAVVKLAK